MNYLKLKYFIDMADCGSISAAARKNIIAQQSMSACLRSLEAHYGVKLFRRSTPLQLTPEGQRLYTMAHKVLALMDEFEQSLQPQTKPLRIGLAFNGTPPFLSDILNTLNEKRAAPLDVSIEVNCAGRHPLPEDIDLFIGMTPPEDCESIRLMEDRQAVAVSRRLWDKTFPERRGETPVCEPMEVLARLPFAIFAPEGASPFFTDGLNIVTRSNSSDVISDMCRRGSCATVIAQDYAEREFSEDILLIPLADRTPGVTLYLYYQKQKPLSASAKAFIAEAKRLFAKTK